MDTPLPTTPGEVRDFVGHNFAAIDYACLDGTPDERDMYTMSAHDIISALNSLRRVVALAAQLAEHHIQDGDELGAIAREILN